MDITETKLHRYLSMEIYSKEPFTLSRRHKGDGRETAEVFGGGRRPIQLKETEVYVPFKVEATHGAGLAIVRRTNKHSGREEYVVLTGATEELYEVRTLAEGRIAELQARAPKPVAAPVPPRRSHKRKVSV